MGPVRIRSGGSGDLPALRSLYRRSSLSVEADRANLLAHPAVLVLDDRAVAEGRTRVALCDGRIVGFATTHDHDGGLVLSALFVEPGVQRRGVGRALVDDVRRRATARGVRSLTVTANPAALPFYRSVGFVPIGTVDTRFGPAPLLRLDL